MNVVDVLLVAVLVAVAVRGAREGALAQLAGLAGFGVGLAVGLVAAPRVAGAVVDGPGLRLALVTLAALVVATLVGQAAGAAGGRTLRSAVRLAGAGLADRAAGIVVGLLGAALGVWLLSGVLASGPVPALAGLLRSSQVATAITDALPPPPDVVSRVGLFLSRRGFPQVFAGLPESATAPPVDPPGDAAVAAAQAAAADGTVQVLAPGCGGVSAGSGFAVAPGFVVTNAHVVAGAGSLAVRDAAGTSDAVAISVDTDLDLAVLSAPGSAAAPLPLATEPAERGTQGATLGYPGGQDRLVAEPAAVRSRREAVGRDVYGRGLVRREVLTLSAGIEQGDSGGPFVTADGQVAGVVFAAAADGTATGYALTAASVADDVAAAIDANVPVGTGECRF